MALKKEIDFGQCTIAKKKDILKMVISDQCSKEPAI